MPILRTAASFSVVSWQAFCKAMVLLPLVDLSLRLRGYASTRSLFVLRLAPSTLISASQPNPRPMGEEVKADAPPPIHSPAVSPQTFPACGGGAGRGSTSEGREIRAVAEPTFTLAKARELALGVTAAAHRIPWPATCLRQAIVLERLLNREGIPCAVLIGVSNDPEVCREQARSERFSAHAWVEVEGEVVLGGEQSPQRYHIIKGFT